MRAGLLGGASLLALAAAWQILPAQAQDVTFNTPAPTLDITGTYPANVIIGADFGSFSTPVAVSVLGASAPPPPNASIAIDLINNGTLRARETGLAVGPYASIGRAIVNNGSVLVDVAAGLDVESVGVLHTSALGSRTFGFQNTGTVLVDVDADTLNTSENSGYGYRGYLQTPDTLTLAFDNSADITVDVESRSQNVIGGVATATGVEVLADLMLGTLANSGDISVTAINSGPLAGSAHATGIDVRADDNGMTLRNSGVIDVYAAVNSGIASSYGVRFRESAGAADVTFDGGTLINEGGTIAATYRTTSLGALQLGVAVDAVNDHDAIIELRGGATDPGFVLGHILLNSTGDEVRVSDGETIFTGSINPLGDTDGLLSIFGGGTLRLGNAVDYRGQTFGASDSYVERLEVEATGTLAFMLGAGQTAADIPTINADTVELAGIIKAHFAPGSVYAAGTSYTYAGVVQSGSALSGERFDEVASNTPLMTVGVQYNDGAGTVTLTASRVAFGDVPDLTDNEQDIADYLDDVYVAPPGDPFLSLFDQFFSELDGVEEYREALRELSGAEHAQAMQLQLNSFNELDQIIAGRWIGEESPFEPFGYATMWGGPAAGAAYRASQSVGPGASVWARGYATLSNSNGDENAPAYAALAYGGHVGADVLVQPNIMVGATGGYLVEAVDFGEGDRLDYAGFQGAGYGLFDNGSTFGRALGGYGYYQNASKRHVTIGTMDETASADYVSQFAHIYSEVGHRVIDTGSMSISPIGTISGTIGWSDGFTETGLSAGNLVVAPSNGSSLVASAGLQFEGENAMMSATLITRGRLAYEYEFLDSVAIGSTFAGVPTSIGSFSTTAEGVTRGLIAAGLGATMEFSSGTSISADYKGRFAEGFMENSATLLLQQKF